MSNTVNFETLQNNARGGDSNAQYQLARAFKEGKLTTKNIEQYIKWLTAASKGNSGAARFDLSNCYFTGEGVEKSDELGVYWLKEAISLKEFRAYTKMALILLSKLETKETGISDELKKAEQLLRAAANQGDPLAQYNLGLIYKTGLQGLNGDEVESLRWLLNASENGNLDAQNELGYIYTFGSKKIKKNDEEALKWWKKAAEKGHVEAQYNLATFYAKQAVKYWSISAKEGDEKAKYMLNQIKMLEWDK